MNSIMKALCTVALSGMATNRRQALSWLLVAGSATGGLVLTATPAQASPIVAYYSTTTAVGERLAPVAAPNGRYGIPAGGVLSVECQVIGQPVGRFGNTLYLKGFFGGRELYLPDAFSSSPHLAEQPPIAGIPMCGSVAQPRPSGAGNFANAAVADYMLARVGQYMGDCRNAANIAVSSLSGGAMQLGGEPWDYTAGFRRVRAYQVPNIDQAVKGDIVQVGNGIHTYFVVLNRGGGNLRIVDSNHALNGRVMTYDRSFNYRNQASQSTIWRVGRA